MARSHKAVQESARNVDRRTWMKLLPAIAAVSAMPPHLLAQNPPGAPAGIGTGRGFQQQVPQRVTKEMLHQALNLIGIEFTDAEETMMLPGINRSLANYEILRKINIPLDTEPGFRFIPLLPGRKTPSGLAMSRPSRSAMPVKEVERLDRAGAVLVAKMSMGHWLRADCGLEV
jgi:hypothetical protein